MPRGSCASGRPVYLGSLLTTGGARNVSRYRAERRDILGLPVIASNNVPLVGSPGTASIVLIAGDEIFLADDGGGVTLDVSNEAALQMVDETQRPGAGATTEVSLCAGESQRVARRTLLQLAAPGTTRACSKCWPTSRTQATPMDLPATNGGAARPNKLGGQRATRRKHDVARKRFPGPAGGARERANALNFAMHCARCRSRISSCGTFDRNCQSRASAPACSRFPTSVNFEALQLICDEQREINRRQKLDEIISSKKSFARR